MPALQESFGNARGDSDEVHANFLEFTSTPHSIQASPSSVSAGMTCTFAHLDGDAFWPSHQFLTPGWAR